MDLQTRKLEFIQEFLKLSSEEAVSRFEALMKIQKSEVENPFSKEELIHRVKQSETDFKEGNYKTAEELLECYQ